MSTDPGPAAILVVLLVLIMLLAFGSWRRHQQTLRRRVWVRTEGEVVRENTVQLDDSTGTDKVIRFRTLDGHDVEAVPRNGVSLGVPVVGRRVPVWYDPADPHRFEAQVHRLDRAGSFTFLVAIVPALLLVGLLLP